MQAVPTFNPILLKKVDEVELSERTVLVLKNGSILHLGDLVQRTEIELLRVPHLGETALIEIKTVLAGMDLHLGMEVRDCRQKTSDSRVRSVRPRGRLAVCVLAAAGVTGRQAGDAGGRMPLARQG